MKVESSWRGSLSWIHLTLALFCIAVCSGVCPAAEPVARLEIPAWSFDRGNASVVENPHTYADYRDIHPELQVTGKDGSPWQVEQLAGP